MNFKSFYSTLFLIALSCDHFAFAAPLSELAAKAAENTASTSNKAVADTMKKLGWTATNVRVLEGGSLEFATRAGRSEMRLDAKTGEVYADTFVSTPGKKTLTDTLESQSLVGEVVDRYQTSEFGWRSDMKYSSIPTSKTYTAKYEYFHKAIARKNIGVNGKPLDSSTIEVSLYEHSVTEQKVGAPRPGEGVGTIPETRIEKNLKSPFETISVPLPGVARFQQIVKTPKGPILEVVYEKEGKLLGQRYQFDLISDKKGQTAKAKAIGEPESIQNVGQFNFRVVEAKGTSRGPTPAVK